MARRKRLCRHFVHVPRREELVLGHFGRYALPTRGRYWYPIQCRGKEQDPKES